MIKDLLVENVIILLDISRSMRRTDFQPTRFNLVLKGIRTFLIEKHRIDEKDSFGIIFFSDKVHVLSPLTDNFAFLLDLFSLRNLRKKFTPNGNNSSLNQALEKAIEMLSDRIRTIGEQVYRIIVITDQYQFSLNDNLLNIAKTAEGLNIFIDFCVLHTSSHILARENYLAITNITRGELGHFYSKDAFLKGMKGFASKKYLEESNLRLISSREKEDGTYLSEIAQNLRFPTSDEKEKILQNKHSIKCQICFDYICPINNFDFSKTGRFCPHCNTPMHIHCAGLWAQKTEVAPTLFRCPHCYTLLKIQSFVLKGLETRQRDKNNPNERQTIVKMIRLSSKDLSKLNKINSSQSQTPIPNKNSSNSNLPELICQFCFKPISDQDSDIKQSFYCSHCNAPYHVKCLEEMFKQHRSCANCGGKII